MTITLRFSTALASALLLTSMALHASAADPPAPASDADPRKHSLSVTAGLTPFYMGGAMGYDDLNKDRLYSYEPLLAGLSGDWWSRNEPYLVRYHTRVVKRCQWLRSEQLLRSTWP